MCGLSTRVDTKNIFDSLPFFQGRVSFKGLGFSAEFEGAAHLHTYISGGREGRHSPPVYLLTGTLTYAIIYVSIHHIIFSFIFTS